MNSSFSDYTRSSAPNISFSTSILIGDLETREYKLFLSGALHGFVKLRMAKAIFKTATFFFLFESGVVLDVYLL